MAISKNNYVQTILPMVGTEEVLKKDTEARLLERENLAWELRVRNVSASGIANKINEAGLGPITRQRVNHLLVRIETRNLRRMEKSVASQKSRQTAVLWNLVEQCQIAWEKSMQSQKTTSHTSDDKNGESTTETIKESCGDVRYISEIRALLADIRKIWGLDSPIKVAPTTPDGKESFKLEVVNIEKSLEGLSVDELRSLKSLSDRIRAASEVKQPDQPLMLQETPEDFE